MNLLVLQGSPKKKGNTAQIINAFLEKVPESYNVSQIHCRDLVIHPCTGCDVCHRTLGEPGCVYKDDFEQLYKAMKQADVIVFASPVYCWDFTTYMKVIMDRCYSLVKWQNGEKVEALLAKKKSLLVCSCSGSKESNGDLITKIFDRQMAYEGVEVLGHFVADHCSTPEAMGNVPIEIATDMMTCLEESQCI